MNDKKTHKCKWGLDEPVWGLDEPKKVCVKSVSNVKYTPLQNTIYATYTKCKKEHIPALSYIVMSALSSLYPRLESNQHLILRRDLFYPLNYEGI